MNKTILIGVFAVLLVAGVFLVSGHITTEDSVDIDTPEIEQETCGPTTCNSNCRGGCGIPTCGCSR